MYANYVKLLTTQFTLQKVSFGWFGILMLWVRVNSSCYSCLSAWWMYIGVC